MQRVGYGKKLFEYMLEQEGACVEGLAYDNPTQSMNNFLKRHYGLQSCCDQANSFVTLEGFFAANENGTAKDPNCTPTTVGQLEAAAPKASPSPNQRYPGFRMQDPNEQYNKSSKTENNYEESYLSRTHIISFHVEFELNIATAFFFIQFRNLIK